MPQSELTRIESWLQDAIVRPSLSRSARGEPREPAERNVLPSSTLTPAERVGIYSGMYLARMLEVLSADYVALKAVAGAETFEKIAKGYLSAHPSTNWSINLVGRELPDWLDGDVRVPRRALLADLARVENAMSRVFDAEHREPVTPADLAELAPEVLADPLPRLVPALELVACAHAANEIVTAVRAEAPLPDMGRRRTWTVVWRKDDVVWRKDYPEAAWTMLAAIAEGARLSRAVERGAAVFRGTPDEMSHLVQHCFAEWIAEGFFAAVE